MNTQSRFSKELLGLGKTDNERAATLGISRMTLAQLKAGRIPRSVLILTRQPQLLRALADDIEAPKDSEPQPA